MESTNTDKAMNVTKGRMTGKVGMTPYGMSFVDYKGDLKDGKPNGTGVVTEYVVLDEYGTRKNIETIEGNFLDGAPHDICMSTLYTDDSKTVATYDRGKIRKDCPMLSEVDDSLIYGIPAKMDTDGLIIYNLIENKTYHMLDKEQTLMGTGNLIKAIVDMDVD